MLIDKLSDANSYQRNIGVLLISKLAKWDKDNKIDKIIDLYLNCCNDEKPITSRQAIQSLIHIIPYKENLYDKIVTKLISIDPLNIKETMRKLIVLDTIDILTYINNCINDNRIMIYFNDILNSSVFDEKINKEIKNKIGN